MSYRLAPQAEADIELIADFMAKYSPRAAVQFVESWRRRWELLATQPRSGSPSEELLPGLRHVVIGSYIAFYRTTGEDVEILRVLHGSRDIGQEDIGA